MPRAPDPADTARSPEFPASLAAAQNVRHPFATFVVVADVFRLPHHVDSQFQRRQHVSPGAGMSVRGTGGV